MSPSISLLAISLALLVGNISGQVAMTFMYGQTNGLTGKGFGTMDGAPRDVSGFVFLLADLIIIYQCVANLFLIHQATGSARGSNH